VAVLLGERGLGGQDADLELRLRRWKTERGPRAENAWRLAERWSRLVQEKPSANETDGVATAIALAFPDRIAKRRDASGETWASAGGRGFKLDPTSPLARAEWLAVAETQGMAAGARILSAAQIDPATVETLFADRIETRRTVRFDPATARIETLRERRLGSIRLSSGPDSNADPQEIEAALLEAVRQHGLALLPWSGTAAALRTRAGYAGIEALSDEALIADLDDWLPPALAGKRRFDAVESGALTTALNNRLGWDGQQALERIAPARFESPAGSSHEIDYAAEAGPTVELRPQALFGLATHPMIGTTPLVLSLTSPAGRPIQTTRDLPGFWAGSWAAVAKEMRGRYPRHPWPDDPASANATLRTKNADARAAGKR
ncbi:ATP-dependent helicase C-terminal domain-containing protein, partial [Sphingomonas sp. AOB5]|uniref:ATP-dependent helicase C-terminal domain-containing protein n=1 Tax=Sphingomonas sp. AOB5 TaxID=3034017 RepID=UPI0023F71808